MTSLFVDVVNSQCVLVNSLQVYTSEVVPPPQNFSWKFHAFEFRSLAPRDGPFLYFAFENAVKKFNIYTGEEHTAQTIPEGYAIFGVVPPASIYLSHVSTSKRVLMDVKNGQLSEPDSDQVKEQWPAAISYWASGIKVEKSGEKLDLDVRNFFQTPDEFVVGYTRREKAMTLNYIISIDPGWMDTQLKQSRLYDLQRKELVSEEDYPSVPTPSIPWY